MMKGAFANKCQAKRRIEGIRDQLRAQKDSPMNTAALIPAVNKAG